MLDMPAAEVNVAAVNNLSIETDGGIREHGGKAKQSRIKSWHSW
jgi:hypothetical protein